MRTFCVVAAVGLSLIGGIGAASAQSYGRPGYDYGDRNDGYADRDRGFRERDRGYDDRGPRSRGRDYGFDEREYLRCNPDVRASVMRGETRSGAWHYQTFGRREHRRLSC